MMFKRAIPWSRQCYQRGAKPTGKGKAKDNETGLANGNGGRGGKGSKRAGTKGIDTMAIVSKDRIIHNFSL